MTPAEARKVKVGAAVVWRPTQERGTVQEKAAAGIRVVWADGTNAVYTFAGSNGVTALNYVDAVKP